MQNLVARIWRDSVWSKVISTAITASVTLLPFGIWWRNPSWTLSVPVWLLIGLVFLVVAGWALLLWLAIVGAADDEKPPQVELEPKLTVVDISIPQLDKNKTLTYPLKCYVTLRNDSRACADVGVS